MTVEHRAAPGLNDIEIELADPKRTRIAEQADLFIQMRPGTDVVLALAMAAELERRGRAVDGPPHPPEDANRRDRIRGARRGAHGRNVIVS